MVNFFQLLPRFQVILLVYINQRRFATIQPLISRVLYLKKYKKFLKESRLIGGSPQTWYNSNEISTSNFGKREICLIQSKIQNNICCCSMDHHLWSLVWPVAIFKSWWSPPLFKSNPNLVQKQPRECGMANDTCPGICRNTSEIFLRCFIAVINIAFSKPNGWEAEKSSAVLKGWSCHMRHRLWIVRWIFRQLPPVATGRTKLPSWCPHSWCPTPQCGVHTPHCHHLHSPWSIQLPHSFLLIWNYRIFESIVPNTVKAP